MNCTSVFKSKMCSMTIADLTVDELSVMFPQISRSLLHETITETHGYQKLPPRWVPKQLTDKHKLNRVET